MSDANEPRKVNLADAIREKLAQKNSSPALHSRAAFKAVPPKHLKAKIRRSRTTNAVVQADHKPPHSLYRVPKVWRGLSYLTARAR